MKDHKSDSLRAKAEKKIEHLTDVKLNDISADDARQLAHDLQVHQIELEMQNEELRRTQSELEQSRSKYSDLYDFAPVGYFTFDKTGLILEVNLTGAEQLGMERRSLIKKPFSGFIHKDDQDLFYLHRQQVLKSKSRQNIEIRVKRVEGAEFHAHLECLPVLDKEGNVTLMRTAISDITDHIRVELLLALAREEWERTFDAIPDIVMVTDPHHRITKANIALARKLGVKREDLIGQFCYNVIHGTDKPPSYCPHVITLTNGTENIAEIFEDTLKDHFILSSSPIRDSEGNITGAIEIFRNISSLKKMEEQLRAASLTDALTGLFNRRGFFTLAEQQCKLADRTKRIMSLMYLDLNDMKKINDEFGHKEGDQALMDISDILRNSFRESDIIARFGGDEFAVLLTEHPAAGIENVICNNIQDKLKTFNDQSGRRYNLSLSMGFANFDPERPCSIENLISHADASMYEDKKKKLSRKVLSALNGEMTEHRKCKRYSPGNMFRAKIGASETIEIKNISHDGICMTNIHHLVTDKFHSMKLYCGDEEIPAKGIVVWSRLTDTENYEAGLKFIGLTDNNKQSLRTVITGLSFD